MQARNNKRPAGVRSPAEGGRSKQRAVQRHCLRCLTEGATHSETCLSLPFLLAVNAGRAAVSIAVTVVGKQTIEGSFQRRHVAWSLVERQRPGARPVFTISLLMPAPRLRKAQPGSRSCCAVRIGFALPCCDIMPPAANEMDTSIICIGPSLSTHCRNVFEEQPEPSTWPAASSSCQVPGIWTLGRTRVQPFKIAGAGKRSRVQARCRANNAVAATAPKSRLPVTADS